MNKGFTLIEIIISVFLITLIGTTSIILVSKDNKSAHYEEALNRALEAVNVYINTEKDSAGNTYFKGIYKGGEGVIIPAKDLYNKGYINESDYKVIVKQLSNDKEYFVAGFKDEDECESGVSISIADAGSLNNTMYICGYKVKSNSSGCSEFDCSECKEYYEEFFKDSFKTPQIELIDKILPNGNRRKIVQKNSYDQLVDFLHRSYDNYDIYEPVHNGLYKTTDDTYYYRGNIGNNWVKINDEMYRILSFKNTIIKLLKEEAISDLYYTNSNGNTNSKKINNAITSWYNEEIKPIKNDYYFTSENNVSYGLISLEEAEFSGVYNKDVYREIGGAISGTKLFVCTGWIRTGDNLITSTTSGGYRYYVVGGYDKNHGKDDRIDPNVYRENYINSTPQYSIAYYDVDSDKFKNFIRPYVYIDGLITDYEGTGSYFDPFVINP